MSNRDGLHQEAVTDGAPDVVAMGNLEQLIEQIGRRYIGDLRKVVEEVSRLYLAELAAKEQQIAELAQRIDTIGRERDCLEARLRERDQSASQYQSALKVVREQLQALGDEVARRLEPAPDRRIEEPAQNEVA